MHSPAVRPGRVDAERTLAVTLIAARRLLSDPTGPGQPQLIAALTATLRSAAAERREQAARLRAVAAGALRTARSLPAMVAGLGSGRSDDSPGWLRSLLAVEGEVTRTASRWCAAALTLEADAVQLDGTAGALDALS